MLLKAGTDEKYQVVKLTTATDSNNKTIKTYTKYADADAFMAAAGFVEVPEAKKEDVLKEIGLNKKADDIKELYVINDGKGIASYKTYSLVNTSRIHCHDCHGQRQAQITAYHLHHLHGQFIALLGGIQHILGCHGVAKPAQLGGLFAGSHLAPCLPGDSRGGADLLHTSHAAAVTVFPLLIPRFILFF